MNSPTHRPESTAIAALYVAVELSTKEWLLTMSVSLGGARVRARVAPGDRDALEQVIAATRARFGVSAEAPVRSCYEAGRDGFWPHRLLTQVGVSNVVVDSSSIEVSRRARQAKTDRLDGDKLLRMLVRYWSGERKLWQVVHVPTREAEDARHASRALTMLQTERTRYRNRIHSLLALHGVRRVPIDARFAARVAAVRDWAGEPLPAGVHTRLLLLWRVLRGVELERQQARRREHQAVHTATAASVAHRLARLRAIAARSATVLAHELFARDLRNRRQVGALTGLVSAPYDSGTRRIDQGLARSGIPAIRRMAVEIAWAWLRYQPTSALSQWYRTRFGGGGAATRRIGIVALARRLMIALWRYVTAGLIPEGALLKA